MLKTIIKSSSLSLFLTLSTIVSLQTVQQVVAKTTYSDKAWDLCIKYKDDYNLQQAEKVYFLKNYSYNIGIICYSKYEKSIFIIATIYDNENIPKLVGSWEFRDFGGEMKLRSVSDNRRVTIPQNLYKEDFNSVFYDDVVSETELETFLERVMPKL